MRVPLSGTNTMTATNCEQVCIDAMRLRRSDIRLPIGR